MLTKSDLILRDLDILEQINEQKKAVVQMTLTTADENLCRIIEPHVCTTARRFEVLETMRVHHIPTVIWLTPVLPFLNDTEENLRGILRYCTEAQVKGIVCFGMGVTLRAGDREYFYAALDRHFPGLRRRYEQTYGSAYEVTSPNNAKLMRMFQDTCEAHGILHEPEQVFAYLKECPPDQEQLPLF